LQLKGTNAEAEPHVSNWFRTLPDIDISITFYNWAGTTTSVLIAENIDSQRPTQLVFSMLDLHITHIQDHPSWFRNSPYPFHLKRNITFINTGKWLAQSTNPIMGLKQSLVDRLLWAPH